MTNAIFDLSNMFFRSLYIVGGYGVKSYTFDNQTELDQLMRKVATDVSQVIRQVNPSRILFALDSKSWRKEISIDENDGYKAQRTKSEHVNWDNVFKIMKEFSDILETNGFIVSRFERAEADDLMALWRNEFLFEQGQHVIIVSADEDVRQLVNTFNFGVNKVALCTVFNPFTQGKNSIKKLFVPKEFFEWIKDDNNGDIFDRSIDVDKEDFQRISNDPKVKVEEIDGEEIAMRKIFCGDDGDNVPAIYTWLNDKGKEVRITDSKYRKIVDYIGAKEVKDLLNNKDQIYDQLVNISGHKPPFKINDRLQRQMKLVLLLNPDLFPIEIVSAFKNKVAEELSKPQIHPQNWNMISILEGTRYVTVGGKYKSNTGKEASIFGDTDKMIEKSKPLF